MFRLFRARLARRYRRWSNDLAQWPGDPRWQRDEFYILVAGTGRYRMEDRATTVVPNDLGGQRREHRRRSSATPSGPYSLAMNATANAGGGSRASCGLGWMVLDEVYAITIELFPIANLFCRGHRPRLDI